MNTLLSVSLLCASSLGAQTVVDLGLQSFGAAKTVKAAPSSKPLWVDINPTQQAALAPLQTEWPKISETQKRKWLEVSKNFDKLPSAEQAKLHSRMKDWVALSPAQRAQARLNFSTAKSLSPEEKKKQWQAYQALSPEEKKTLKATAATPNSAALATQTQNKIVPVKKADANSNAQR